MALNLASLHVIVITRGDKVIWVDYQRAVADDTQDDMECLASGSPQYILSH